MGYLVRMPQMGMSMDEGTVVEWTVDEGGPTEEGEPVVVVESEKAQADVDARETAVLRRILVAAGGVVEPGDPIGIVAGEDEDISDLEAQVDGDVAATGSAADDSAAGDAGSEPADDGAPVSTPDDVKATPGAKKLAGEEGVDLAGVEGSGPAGAITEDDVRAAVEAGAESDDGAEEPAAEDVKATPGAKRLAGETGVSLASIEGSGPGGVVTEDDVEAAAETASGEPAEAPAGGGGGPTVSERRELTGAQATISRRLSESYRNAVHVTLNRTIDTTAMDDHVEAARTLGMDHGYNDLLLAASADALAAHPEFNAHFEDDEHVLYSDVNVGVAVDTEGGLLTPVIANVDGLGLAELNEARTALTRRVLDGDFDMDDLSGGTFTISNLGMFGVDHFDPVINPPQVAILGVGRRRDDATMTLSLSFDHRVENGAAAAKFLGTIAENLEDPETLSGYLD